MYLNIHWDLSEIICETKFRYPKLDTMFPNLKEAVSDLVAMALRDRVAGVDYDLNSFIRDNLGSEFHYLGLFFKAQSARWYQEILHTTALYTYEYDEFYIEDIRQLTPSMLLIKVWVEYHYEGAPFI